MNINLLQQQQDFLNSILGDQDGATSLQEQLSSGAGIDRATGIAIYRNNYRGALLAHLAQCYWVCRQLVGDEAFDFIADKFIIGTPSLAQDINVYGSEFIEFIAGLVKTKPGWQHLNYLPEVARLEYLLHHLYYTPSSPPVDLSQLSALMQYLDPDTLMLSLPDQLCLLATNYPAVEIWQAHEQGHVQSHTQNHVQDHVQDHEQNYVQNYERAHKQTHEQAHENDECGRPGIAAIKLDCGQQQDWLIVRNSALKIEFHPLGSGEYQLLSGISAEAMTLSQVVNCAARYCVELDKVLPDWIQRGWLLCRQDDAGAQ